MDWFQSLVLTGLHGKHHSNVTFKGSTVPVSHSRGAGCEARVLLPCNLSSELNIILIFPAYHVPDNILLTSMMKASGLHLCAKEHKYLLCTHEEEENGT